MPPSAAAAQDITNNLDKGLTALGRDYEKKKQKLLLELQLEYKDYVTKKKDRKSHVHDEHQGFSLPIEEKVSLKERLREERKKEYNLFLQEQAQNRSIKKGAHPVTSKPEHQASDAVNITSPGPAPSFLNTQTNTPPHQQESPVSKRNAATLTEAGDYRGSPDTWSHGRLRRRRWQIDQPKKTYSSEEELNTDEEEDFDFRRRRRRGRRTYEQEYKEEWGTPERGGRRDLQDIREIEALSIRDQNSSDGIWKGHKTPQNMKTTARSTPAANKEEKELVTGLMIGAVEERSVTQMKKEQYKQDLLRQMAEQQKNKKREKNAVLKVGATEATAPRKEPESKQQFGGGSQQHESLKQDDFDSIGFDPKCDNPFESSQPTALGQNPPMGFGPAFLHQPGNTLPPSGMGAAQVVPPFNYYSRFPGMQGQVAFPWVPVVPPVPQTVSNADISRYDAAFYQKGTRREDPYSNQHLTRMVGGAQQEKYETPPPRLPPVRNINWSPLDTEGLHGDSFRQRSESTQSYREALRQQVTEKEECTRREQKEKRRDAAQLEAKMMAYDPWGKGGGGAPIKDKQGNLVSDLYHMHKINNRMTSLKAEVESPVSLQESSHQSPLQDRYMEELKQQMEEKKRKQAEERELVRIAEENEQKRVAMERARIQQQYEDEKRREEKERKRSKQSNQAEIHDTKKTISKGEKNLISPQNVSRNERGPSPPILTSRRNHANVMTSRPSSVVSPLALRTRGPSPPIPTLQRNHADVVSPLTSRTERIVSAPNIQPGPESKSSIPAGQQEVIRELSALRRFLRREQRELELQLGQEETRHSDLNKD